MTILYNTIIHHWPHCHVDVSRISLCIYMSDGGKGRLKGFAAKTTITLCNQRVVGCILSDIKLVVFVCYPITITDLNYRSVSLLDSL